MRPPTRYTAAQLYAQIEAVGLGERQRAAQRRRERLARRTVHACAIVVAVLLFYGATR